MAGRIYSNEFKIQAVKAGQKNFIFPDAFKQGFLKI